MFPVIDLGLERVLKKKKQVKGIKDLQTFRFHYMEMFVIKLAYINLIWGEGGP